MSFPKKELPELKTPMVKKQHREKSINRKLQNIILNQQ